MSQPDERRQWLKGVSFPVSRLTPRSLSWFRDAGCIELELNLYYKCWACVYFPFLLLFLFAQGSTSKVFSFTCVDCSWGLTWMILWLNFPWILPSGNCGAECWVISCSSSPFPSPVALTALLTGWQNWWTCFQFKGLYFEGTERSMLWNLLSSLDLH